MPPKPNKLLHPLSRFGAAPLARETLSGYRRPNDKISEWLKAGPCNRCGAASTWWDRP